MRRAQLHRLQQGRMFEQQLPEAPAMADKMD
jgi:hypothetical protein